MKVILTQDVAKVGKKGEVKNVADGFGRNMLIAFGKAVVATPQALARFESEQQANKTNEIMFREQFAALLTKLETATIIIKAKASETGHLFAAIHTDEILAALKHDLHVVIDPTWLKLEKPLKQVGEFQVPIMRGGDRGEFKLQIVAA